LEKQIIHIFHPPGVVNIGFDTTHTKLRPQLDCVAATGLVVVEQDVNLAD
jgi:hypothetical protein